MKGLLKEFFDFILPCLYYRLFVRPRPAAKVAPEWDIDLPAMKAVYKGPQTKGQSPFAGMTMAFYIAEDGEGGETLCGGIDPIPAAAQTSLDHMSTRRRKQFLRRLIEEGDRVFRTAWEQSTKNKKARPIKPRTAFSFYSPWGLIPRNFDPRRLIHLL
jgi:hypothetical protein